MNATIAAHNLNALINALTLRNTRVIGLSKARGVARAMGAVAGVKAVKIGGFWMMRLAVDGATLRLTVPVDAAAAERDGAVIALDGTPAPAVEAPTGEVAPARAAKLAELRAEIQRIEAAPRGAMKAAPAQRRQLPPGESDLSWTVKVATLARSVPVEGSEAWRAWRAS